MSTYNIYTKWYAWFNFPFSSWYYFQCGKYFYIGIKYFCVIYFNRIKWKICIKHFFFVLFFKSIFPGYTIFTTLFWLFVVMIKKNTLFVYFIYFFLFNKKKIRMKIGMIYTIYLYFLVALRFIKVYLGEMS